MNRETWLNELAKLCAPRFEELGHPLPKFRVAVGFTSLGMTKRVNGECWSNRASKDGTFEILISPIEDATDRVAAILVHELAHAADGLRNGHKGPFIAMLQGFGLAKPYTASVPTDAFRAYISPFIEQLGELPHAALDWGSAGKREARAKLITPKAGEPVQDDGAGEDEGGESSRPKKQTTRLLKVICKECGYPARVTKKWIDEVGAPHCPQHGQMVVEGGEENEKSQGGYKPPRTFRP